jgi:arsenite methyltransferase
MHELVKDYYGNQLKSSADLRTSACCDASLMPEWMKPLLARIHPEVMSRYYGCGLVCPTLLDGLSVLDLGCGSGRDVYALSQLVGEAGKVVGVDMTEEQLAVAEAHREHPPPGLRPRPRQRGIQARLHRAPGPAGPE